MQEMCLTLIQIAQYYSKLFGFSKFIKKHLQKNSIWFLVINTYFHSVCLNFELPNEE